MPEAFEPAPAGPVGLSDDEAHLAKLGYRQDLHRSWSGFSNFAISFSIISILAGCLTNFGAGFNNGGPISISWSWPILGVFILIIGFTMSELVSAYPTSGGIYWWASKLGGPKAGFFTGWLNLIGLVAVTAGVAYGCATFIDLTLDTYSVGWAKHYSLNRVFIIFVIVLLLAAVLNIFSGHLMAIMNNVSVWWHVVGAAGDHPDPDPRPRPPPVLQLCVHAPVQQLRVGAWQHEQLRVLLRDHPVRLPADAVHDHRLRRLRPPLGGDRVSGQGGREGHLALDLLLGDRRLPPAALRRVRDPQRRQRQAGRRLGRARRATDLRRRDGVALGRHRAVRVVASARSSARSRA